MSSHTSVLKLRLNIWAVATIYSLHTIDKHLMSTCPVKKVEKGRIEFGSYANASRLAYGAQMESAVLLDLP